MNAPCNVMPSLDKNLKKENMNQKLKHLLAWLTLAIFVVLAVTLSATDVKIRDAQETNQKTGKPAVFRAQDNGDGTYTLLVVLATPGPTLTPTPTPTASSTSTPSATATATGTATPSATP